MFQFPTLTLGGQQNYPNYTWQDNFQGRLDVNWHKGKHEMKFGGELQKDRDTKVWDLNRRGTYVFNNAAVDGDARTPASRQDAWNNPSAWNINAPPAVPAGVRHHLQPGLPGRRAAAELLRRGSATTGARPTT